MQNEAAAELAAEIGPVEGLVIDRVEKPAQD
jgi:hypothetical protein